MTSNESLFEDEYLDQELENILNHPAPPYSEKSFWNSRYESSTEEFDWYLEWAKLKASVSQFITPSGIALVLGCGNSSMSSQLLSDGFEKVVSIDFSDVVINQMKKMHSKQSKLEWDVGDITKMKYQNNSFDYVFDKATFDTLLCGDNSNKVVLTLLKEISRVLKPGGTFVIVSYGTPETRKRFFDGNQTPLSITQSIKVEKPGFTGTSYYIYVIKKVEQHQ